jgi:hypothetical protein
MVAVQAPGQVIRTARPRLRIVASLCPDGALRLGAEPGRGAGCEPEEPGPPGVALADPQNGWDAALKTSLGAIVEQAACVDRSAGNWLVAHTPSASAHARPLPSGARVGSANLPFGPLISQASRVGAVPNPFTE